MFEEVAGLVRADVAIGPLTTYKLGGPTSFYAEVSSRDELEVVLAAWRPTGLRLLVLGRGSNLVIHEDGIDALVVRLTGEFGGVIMEEETILAGAAVRLPQLARAAVAGGRLGLEFFVGIPGSVGGAVRQNAGGHGRETSEVLVDVGMLDASTGEIGRRLASELDLGYRHSSVQSHEVVLEARFSFEQGERATGEALMREITRWRKEYQPGGTLNAGSVFKNPPGDSAGRIIDELGLKGTRVGGVSVSHKHANFFVADSDATGSDLFRLVEVVRNEVLARTGIELEREIQFEGFA